MIELTDVWRRCVAVSVCVLFVAWPSLARAYVEAEPNNSWAAPQLFANPTGDFFIDGGRSFANPSDDFFRFTVYGAGWLRIESSSADGGADSIMGLFDGMGTLLASNDDGAGTGTMSVIEYLVTPGQIGSFTIGFSGYNPGLLACTETVTQCYDTNGDFVFDTFVAGGGAGGSTGWDYRISLTGVALVPEPATALLFAPALGWLLLRRRRGAPPG